MTKNLLTTKDNWFSWEDKNKVPIVKHYPLHTDCPESLSHALQLQAKTIFDDFKNHTLVCSLSGGIDSQQMAYGFIKSNLPVKYVYFMCTLNNRPEKELIYVEEFGKKHNVKIDIIEKNFTKEELIDLTITSNFIRDGKIGTGYMLFNPLYKDFLSKHPNHLFLNSTIDFNFFRDEKRCYGGPYVGFDVLNDMTMVNTIPFNIYTTYLIQYYEYIHKNNRLMQFPKRFQPKHLAYTELGFDLREKIGQCDWFSESFHEPEERTRIDFAETRSMVPSTRSNFLLHILNVDKKRALNLRKRNISDVRQTMIELYSFETDVDRYDL